MNRSFARNVFLAGAIGIGLALPSLAAEAVMPSGKPVQSNASTASAGRRPLAVRIAMADKVKTVVKAVAAPVEMSVAESPVPAVAEAPVIDGGSATDGVPETDGAIDTVVAERPAVPRLQIDCEESSIDARHGETIRWRITIRNAGAAAHHVVATLYFAQGIEPTAAKGHDHSLASGEARFSPVETLGPDDAIQLEVTGHAVQPGAVGYRIEVGCRDLPGHVAREAMILVRPKSED